MKVRLWAVAGLVIVLAASGSGGTAAEPAAPAYGTIGSLTGGAQTLVRLDPVTLKPLAGGLSISNDFSFGGRSPDGRSAAYFNYRRPALRVVDLEGLKNRGDVGLAPAGWRARAAAWLTADRVAVVIQRMRGSYSQIVDRREVVIVDPFARRVVARRQLAVSTAVTASVSGGDKLVLLLGRGDARTRTVRVAVVDPTGAVRTINVDLGVPKGLRLPALAVEPSGRRAFVFASGAPMFEIDLDTLAATPHVLEGAGAVVADAPVGSRQAVLLDGGTLAVTGHNTRRDRGVEIADPAGLAFIDTSTWQTRLIDRNVSGVSASGDTLVGYSFRIERVQRGGRAAQKAVGIGLRAYAADGTRRWQRFGTQPLIAHAFRQSALVYRHLSPPVGSGGSFVVDLADGRQIRANTGAQQNVWLLPDVPGARPVRAPAAVTAEALQVEGGGEEFRGTVPPEVTRVVAALVDGSERELTIEAGGVTYRALTPHESARTVQAFAGDQLVASISLPVACGGSAGPCAGAEAAAGGTFAVLRTPDGTSLAEIDPKTLTPLPARSIAIDRSTSAHALSANGSLAAVGSYANATLRVFATAKFDPAARTTLVAPLAPGNAGVRALEWLAPTRLVAIVQKYKRSDRRAVSARELVVIDPQAHHVIRRTALPIGRAIVDVQASGGRLVAILRSSNHRGTGIMLVVANAEGGVRTHEIRLRESDGVLPETRLTLERGGKRAFLFAWQHSGAAGPQPVREINLDQLTVTQRAVTIAEGRFYRPSGFSAWAESFGDNAVLISGAYVPLFRDGRHVPAAGIFIVDTRTFQIRQLDARATAVAIAGDRAYTYGSSVLLGATRPRGIGVTAYDTNGKRLYRGFGTRSFARLLVADGYGHLLRGDRTNQVVFELASGRSLGTRAAPDAEIEVLEAAAAAPLTSAPTRRPSAAAPAAVTADPSFARVSNRGTRVKPKATKRGEREMTPNDLFLLRRDEGRAVYRIGGLKPGYSSCYASGPGSDIGRLSGINCSRSGFPSQRDPLQNMSVTQQRRGEKTPRLYRLEGVAADAIAEIALTNAGGSVIERVPVRDNVYVLARPPAAATGGLVAYDSRGEVVFRSDEHQRPQRPVAPAPVTNPRRLAGFRLKITLPRGWSGEIRRSGARPFRALLLAGNRLPTRDPRSVSLALTERDPRAKPPFLRVAEPPQLRSSNVRPVRSGQGRVERGFTYKGRQFSLQLVLGSSHPLPAQLDEINRALATLSVGAIAVQSRAVPAGKPLQRGSDDGVSIDVYGSGIVVFRFDPGSRLYRQLQGKQPSVACLTFDSVSPWEPNEWWSSNRKLAETMQFIVSDATRPQPPYATVDPATEAKPPFDGCLVSGSYGRRWNDPRGQHSPAEIAFTATGKRFFDERAVARDLAMFVRSPKLVAARRSLKRGSIAPAAAALTRGLPVRVVALAERGRLPAAGEIGVWSNHGDTIEVSARSAAGKRMFIELRDGRIVRHNLEGLAFVF
jgi:hypothetical protein